MSSGRTRSNKLSQDEQPPSYPGASPHKPSPSVKKSALKKSMDITKPDDSRKDSVASTISQQAQFLANK